MPLDGGRVIINNNTALGNSTLQGNYGILEASTPLTGANAITNTTNPTVGGPALPALSIGGRSTGLFTFAGAAMEFTGGLSFFRATGTSGELRFNVNNATTISGTAIATTGAGTATGITIGGVGTLTLAGNNTAIVEGLTVIDSLKVVVSGSIAGSTVTVAPTTATTATLASSGLTNSIAPTLASGNAVTIGGGAAGSTARLAPGDVGAVGTMNFTLAAGGAAKLAFASGSELNFDISGMSSDLVSFSTPDDWLTGSGTAVLALNGLTIADYGNTYTVFQNVTTTGFTFAGITGYDSANYNAIFGKSGTNYTLSFTAVPEPSAVLSLAFGTVALLTFRRLRRVA